MPLSKMLEDYRNKKREFPTYDELAAIASHEPCADPIVERNVSLLRQRSTVGVQKYGTTLADNKLPLRAWLNHALEEALDQANYLQAAMAEIDCAERALPPLPEYFPLLTNIRSDEESRAKLYAQDYARSALQSTPAQEDTSENAPWLTLAHIICADAGVPPGHISDRLKALRDKLEAPVQAKETRKLTDISRRLREYAGNNGYSHNDYADTMRDAADEIERMADNAAALSDAYRALQNTLLAVPASPFKREMDDWLSQRLGVIGGMLLPVPSGWKLVPIEPTDAMAVAAIEVTLGNSAINGVAQYRAMIAAAPVAQPEVRKPIMWAALNMNGKVVCVNQDKSACDVERLCIKTPTTIAPLYAGAPEPQ